MAFKCAIREEKNLTSNLNCLFLFRLVSVNEEVQQAALRELYGHKGNQEQEKKIKRLQHFGRVIYPTLCICFVITFWVLGMVHQS